MKKIVILAPHFLPGFRGGGPIKSIQNLLRSLSQDFEFYVITSDRDLGDDKPYHDVETDCWIAAHGGHIRYCSPPNLSAKGISKILRSTPHDLLYLNSFFSPLFTIYPLFMRKLGIIPRNPCLLAPRGEFSSGALALKAVKKKVYITAARSIGIFSDVHFHASTELESSDIKNTIGNTTSSRIHVARNIASVQIDDTPNHTPRKPGDPLRIVFVSRISPKKNLDFALSVLAGVDYPIVFSIVGPEEDVAYSNICRSLAKKLPEHIQVDWLGPLLPQEVSQVVSANDLFFLPTKGENFGHVISESLSVGTPVLIADTTPWRGLSEIGVGHDLPLSRIDLFRAAIERHCKMSDEDAFETRVRSTAHAKACSGDGRDAAEHRSMFLSVE